MKNILFVSVFLLCFSLLFPGQILASSEVIQSFDSKITAHKDGSFDVTETIQYDFGDNNKHGIYRDIPTVSRVGELYRQSKINITEVTRDNSSESYRASESDNLVSVKIGRGEKTISGTHTYKISYQVKNGIGSNYEDHDEIYWNVTGNGWQIPILSASSTITTDFGIIPDKIACFTGPQGSKEQNCRYPQIPPFNPITTTQSLNAYSGLTIVTGFPVNTFPKSILTIKPPQKYNFELIKLIFLSSFGFFNLILAPVLIIWYLKFKHKKRFGPVTVNFDIPKDSRNRPITPAEAGIIDNAKLDQNDIVATIFDLAIKKYIKIEQVKKEKVFGIFGDGEDYIIRKLRNYDDLQRFEIQLLDRLFQDGSEVNLSSLKEDFYQTFDDIQKSIFVSLVSKGFYIRNPKLQKQLLGALTLISAFLLQVILALVLFLLYKKLIGRTKVGDEVDFNIDGLKLFLKNMSREYKWQAENLYTVERYIPYAIALGYIDEFMKQLKIIYPNYQPNWFTGNMSFYLASNSMISSMNSGFTTVAPFSSSGFSGGGFSGGGGGGGGGGSW